MLLVICLSLVAGSLSAPSCQRSCSSNYSPVCGSNGQTYRNSCYFQIASCQYSQKGVRIHQTHSGSCSGGVLIGGKNGNCDQICDEERNPVCGSDGMEYVNRCFFGKAQCAAAMNGTTLSMIPYQNPCPTPTAPNCEQYAKNISDIAIEGPLGTIVIQCPHSHTSRDYICTTRGTYSSECYLCAQIKSYTEKAKLNPSITVPDYKVLHKGSCGSHSIGPNFPGGPVLAV